MRDHGRCCLPRDTGAVDRREPSLPRHRPHGQSQHGAVKRIVFVCVPHRGSYLASNWIGALGVSLIRFPSTFLGETASEIMASLQSNAGLKRLPTGINDLSPQSPVLIGLNKLPIRAPYHSIIGDRGRGDTPNSSDGVVGYWSSHLESDAIRIDCARLSCGVRSSANCHGVETHPSFAFS